MTDNSIFRLENVSKIYKMGDIEVNALKEAEFIINSGELVVVLGPSGSGKSTLLNILGGMDTSTSGKVFFLGTDISKYNENQLTLFRRKNIGFIFQFYNLMPNLTAKENIELATEISDAPMDIEAVLDKVGLKERKDHFPSQMSGGEQQRIAIARAVAKNPEVLLCDEPTGALDYTTGKLVLNLLRDINKESGKTVVIITHNQPIADMAMRVIKMRSGEVVENYINSNPADPEMIEW